MNRMTKRKTINDKKVIVVKEPGNCETFFYEYDEGYAALEKLAKYEDLEEIGVIQTSLTENL